jgi:DNA invertase Pin-like site-specific DNA recombinase
MRASVGRPWTGPSCNGCADCRAGRIGTVITRDPERLAREKGQLLALLHIFEKAGVSVEFGTSEGHHQLVSLRRYLSALTEFDEASGASAEAA